MKAVFVEISGYDADGFAGTVHSPLDTFAHLEITGSISTSPCDLSVEEWLFRVQPTASYAAAKATMSTDMYSFMCI